MDHYQHVINILCDEDHVIKESEIPEPMDNWSIEDFRDFIPREC